MSFLFKNNELPILFREHLEKETELSDNTIIKYYEYVSGFIETAPNLNNIEDYNEHIISKKISKSYVLVFAFRKFIKWYIKNKNERENMLDNLIRVKQNNDIKIKRRYLTNEKLIEVISNMKHLKNQIIALIQYNTGVRVGDVLSIKKEDAHIEDYNNEKILKIRITGKGKKSNVIYIFDTNARDAIYEYIKNSESYFGYVFLDPTYERNPFTHNTHRCRVLNTYKLYSADLNRALRYSQIDPKEFSTHDFRRCYARNVWEKYKDINILQNILNHDNISTTARYLKHSGMQNIDIYKEMQK